MCNRYNKRACLLLQVQSDQSRFDAGFELRWTKVRLDTEEILEQDKYFIIAVALYPNGNCI